MPPEETPVNPKLPKVILNQQNPSINQQNLSINQQKLIQTSLNRLDSEDQFDLDFDLYSNNYDLDELEINKQESDNKLDTQDSLNVTLELANQVVQSYTNTILHTEVKTRAGASAILTDIVNLVKDIVLSNEPEGRFFDLPGIITYMM
ncbi:hypothetical protein WDU94_012501 [Cyamophila willieti]